MDQFYFSFLFVCSTSRQTPFSLLNEPDRHWAGPQADIRSQRSELAAYKLATLPFPGVLGVFYESDRPTKNALEKKRIETTREKFGNASDAQILQKTCDRMK